MRKWKRLNKTEPKSLILILIKFTIESLMDGIDLTREGYVHIWQLTYHAAYLSRHG